VRTTAARKLVDVIFASCGQISASSPMMNLSLSNGK